MNRPIIKQAGTMSIRISPDDIRTGFSSAMSAMYRDEVPAYGTLLSLVAEVNAEVLRRDATLAADLAATDQLDRISQERHGAIRLGTAEELATMRRLFAVMGMYPVGYYDLSAAGVPVHSTAFRPVGEAALRRNPFRVFTSLLRLDLIADAALRDRPPRSLPVAGFSHPPVYSSLRKPKPRAVCLRRMPPSSWPRRPKPSAGTRTRW